MAAYTNSSMFVTTPERTGQVVDYFVDSVADIDNLPGFDKIMASSTALVVATSQVYILTETGWRLLP